MHDGGTGITLSVNGKEVCDSKAIYGGETGTWKGGEGGKGWATMSGISDCSGPIKIAKGDKLYLQADYDLVKHPAYVRPNHSFKHC